MLMFSLFLVFVFTGSCLAAIDLKDISTEFKNVRILRALDLSTDIVKETVGIVAKNTGLQPLSCYYFTIPAHDRPFLSSYQAYQQQKLDESLAIEPLGLDTTEKVEAFKVLLNTPINPEENTGIAIDLAYTHWIRPLPAIIPQLAKQHVTFTAGNIYLFSPYPSDEMTTTFKFPNSNIVSYVGGEPNHVGKKSANQIVYGAFKNVHPLAFGASNFHYEYTNPIVTITELKRELQVSHWGGNLAVTEDYSLRHDGARLLGGFSRLDYQNDREVLAKTNVQEGIHYVLHRKARNIYYTDVVGNISTSRVTHDGRNTLMTAKFRFPSFGGWKVDWRIGYDVHLGYFLRYNKDKFILKFWFLENAQNMTLDKVQVKVILPEGATDVEVTPPKLFNMSAIEHIEHHTFFDSTGRPAVVLFKENVIAEHEQPVIISYKLSTFRVLQKPLVLSLSNFIFFSFTILISRMSWSIGIEVKKEEEVKNVIAQGEKSKRKEKEEISTEQAVEDVTIAEANINMSTSSKKKSSTNNRKKYKR